MNIYTSPEFWVLLVVAVIAWAWFHDSIVSYMGYPFRWKCPAKDCSFEVQSSDLSIVERVQTSHERLHS